MDFIRNGCTCAICGRAAWKVIQYASKGQTHGLILMMTQLLYTIVDNYQLPIACTPLFQSILDLKSANSFAHTSKKTQFWIPLRSPKSLLFHPFSKKLLRCTPRHNDSSTMLCIYGILA